ARVFVKPGKGQITINHKDLAVYFPLDILQYQVKQPLLATDTLENYDIVINLDGGGIKGQAEAARLGIARALCEIDAEFRPVLKKNGFLTRDPREVERKKPGQPGARRKFQFSKR
ncbi:30S ribosomal protein S9, partial [uncultured Alistipes sp.]